MKREFKINLRTILIGMMLAFGSVAMTSCEDIVDAISYDVVVTNNTAEDLQILESLNSGEFVSIGDVPANGSVKEKGFIKDANYRLQAKNATGDVVASTSFKHSSGDQRTWTID